MSELARGNDAPVQAAGDPAPPATPELGSPQTVERVLRRIADLPRDDPALLLRAAGAWPNKYRTTLISSWQAQGRALGEAHEADPPVRDSPKERRRLRRYRDVTDQLCRGSRIWCVKGWAVA